VYLRRPAGAAAGFGSSSPVTQQKHMLIISTPRADPRTTRARAEEAGRTTWIWETRRKTTDLDADVDAGEKPRLEEECFQGRLAR